jgi:hypothetical protein
MDAGLILVTVDPDDFLLPSDLNELDFVLFGVVRGDHRSSH